MPTTNEQQGQQQPHEEREADPADGVMLSKKSALNRNTMKPAPRVWAPVMRRPGTR